MSYSHNNYISVNSITKNGYYGIDIAYSENNSVSNNLILNNYNGIELDNSGNNIISGNTIATHNRTGISIRCPKTNLITDNNITGNYDGIFIDKSSNIIVTDNVFSGNNVAIILTDSQESVLDYNIIENEGIHIFGENIEFWNTHSISTSNTINGKPVYYWRNKKEGSIPHGAGQIILANCSNVVVENQELTNVYTAISLGFSDKNFIRNNVASFNIYDGINLINSHNNEISFNTLLHNNRACIHLIYSHSNNISFNNVSYNSRPFYYGYGILLYHSENNMINDNTAISNSATGISLKSGSNQNFISGNRIERNAWDGINFGKSNNNVVEDNNVNYNDGGIRVSISHSLIICRNTIAYNDGPGVSLKGASNNYLYCNYFIDNTYQLNRTSSANFWYSNNSEGNYWSDYHGKDINSDGIGDTDLPHQGVDRFPLMEIGGLRMDEEGDSVLIDSLPFLIMFLMIVLLVKSLTFIIKKRNAIRGSKKSNKEDSEPTPPPPPDR